MGSYIGLFIFLIYLSMKQHYSCLFFISLLAFCLGPGCRTARLGDKRTAIGLSLQERRTFAFPEQGVYFSNKFKSARLNGVQMVDDSTFRLFVKAENTPINSSPWYAFKVRSNSERKIHLILHYEKTRHRYDPKWKRGQGSWMPIDGLRYNGDSTEAGFALVAGKKELVVSAQEIFDTDSLQRWLKQLGKLPYVKREIIGKSLLGRAIHSFHSRGSDGKKLVIVLSRQHPPEITGFKAMQAFVHTILGDSPLARRFRERYELVCVPMINPDGVDEGHWRHSVAGVDLNRDWEHFVQPETRAVKDYLLKLLDAQDAISVFGVDFHSTYYDVFYTNKDEPGNPTHFPGLTDRWIHDFEHSIHGFEALVKPSPNGGNVSKSWMGKALRTEALTYEVGDNTPRDELALKGKVAAESLMKLLLD